MPVVKSQRDTIILKSLSRHGNQAEIRRANLLLHHADGLSTREIAQNVGLSSGRVRYWLREYRAKGLSIFPTELIEAALTRILEDTKTEEPAPTLEAIDDEKYTNVDFEPKPTEILVSDLCTQYQVDMEHARFVGELATALFDITINFHNLPPNRRSLTEVAGTLHNIGLVSNPEEHHTHGRDILLENNLIGFDDVDQRILAFSTALHRKKFKTKRSEREAALTNLPTEALKDAETIAALVRIADGLDYSGDQSLSLKSLSIEGDEILITIEGPSANENGARALYKSDMWRNIFDIPIQFIVDGSRVRLPETAKEPKLMLTAPKKVKSPGLVPTDPMSEAGRKILRFHFYRMLENDPGTRLGEDIEALHDMRVATRRMRSAVPIFVAYFDKKIIGRFNKDLRRTGRALGRVRDLDVFMEKAQIYIQSTKELDQHLLDPLINDWKEEREAARIIMLKYLESNRYKQFLDDFEKFLETEGAGAIEQPKISPSPYLVFQAVPILIYQRDSVVRGYANIIHDAPLATLHALRIDIKRFRYALEFFREVLGDGANSVIAKSVKLQDHLGDLNDADVACQILIEFLDQWRERERREQVNISGVTHYLAAKQTELRELVETFPSAWEEFNLPETRQQLAQAVSSL